MKLDGITAPVEAQGFTEQKSFRIASNAKGFRILIDKMYSDPKTAIVRELMTNAYDSHILADKVDVPFEIHVPGPFEPWFSIRDFGVGMSHDEVMNLYTTIFASSKDNRNDQVGALGLGSKSPFAYTDTFTTNVWQEGVLRVYNVYISEGEPQIALAHTEESDEPTGVQVSFPVENRDSSAFKTAIVRSSYGFETLPELKNCGYDVSLGTFKKLSEGPDWFIYAPENMMRGIYAKQGCVLYPLNTNSNELRSWISKNEKLYSLTFLRVLSDWQELNNTNIVLEFDIGEIDFAASREELYYSEKCCKHIVDKLQDVVKFVIDEAMALMAGVPTLFEANNIARESANALPPALQNFKKLIREHFANTKFKGRDLGKEVRIDQAIKTRTVTDAKGQVTNFNYPTKFVGISFCYRGYETFFSKASKATYRNMRGFPFRPDAGFRYLPDTHGLLVFVEVLDAKGKGVKAGQSRVKYEIENRGERKSDVLWIKTPSLQNFGFKRLIAALGRPPVILVDSLEIPPAKESDYEYTRTIADIEILDGRSFEDCKNFTLDRAKYYVMLKRGKVEYDGIYAGNIRDLFNAAVKNGWIEDGEIFGIPLSRKSILNKSDEWIDLIPMLQEIYQEHFDPYEARRALDYNKFSRDFDKSDYLLQIANGIDAIKYRNVSNYFNKSVSILRRLQNQSAVEGFSYKFYSLYDIFGGENRETYREVLYNSSYTTDFTKAVQTAERVIGMVERRYPLIRPIAKNGSVNYDTKDLADYIFSLDNSRSMVQIPLNL